MYHDTSSMLSIVKGVAQTAAIFFVMTLLPVASLPLMLIAPCPTLYVYFKHGRGASMICALISGLMLNMLLHPTISVIYIFSYGLCGVVYGEAVRRTSTSADAMLASMTASLLLKLVSIAAVYAMTGINILMPDVSQLEAAIKTIAASSAASVSGLDADAVAENAILFVDYFVMLIPYYALVFVASEMFISLSAASYILKKYGAEPPFTPPPFKDWSFPKNILIVMVAGFICNLIASSDGSSRAFAQIAANLDAVSRTLFMIQGLAMTVYFMNARGMPRVLRVFVVVVTPFIGILGDIFSLLGIVDVGVDLRKKLRSNK